MKHDLNNKNFERKAKRVYSVFACVALLLVVTAVPALAADDPLTVVNNLSDFIFSLIRAIGLILLGFGILMYTMYLRQNTGGGGGGGPSRFGHARTRTLADQGKKVTFNDVAGADEEKEELEEIVEFLRDPQKFTALGARIPKGVLLVGPPGTGKTFAAGCLANFVMHDGKVPLVTSVSRAENVLWDAKGDERTRVLECIRSYDLVVIDDLGAERDSSYMDSRAFDLVDACYRSGRPLIVTTNLTLEDLQHPEDTAHARIYDRLIEMCSPVRFTGSNFRKATAQEKMGQLKKLMNRKESRL